MKKETQSYPEIFRQALRFFGMKNQRFPFFNLLSQLCPLTTVSSHNCVLSQLCPLTTVSSHNCVLSQLCSLTTVFSHNCVLSQLCSLTTVSSHNCPLTTAISCDHSGLSCSDDRSARLTVLIFMFSDNFSDSSSSGSSFSDPSSSGSFFSDRLLDWYDKNGRDLPWRTRGPHPDPYVVWISEIMLQQTTVRTVIPYFGRFMKRFPDIFSLAQADIDEVLFFWQGLGYYTRARKLHECAVYVATELNGRFPEDKESLGKLPGIGSYTSSSIAALAFDRPEAVVDGNVIRVICRLFALSENAYDIRDEIRRRAEKLMPEKRAADYTSAILDLGATVCTPQHPDCAGCPVKPVCLAEHLHIQESLPVLRKPEKTHKKGYVFLIRDPCRIRQIIRQALRCKVRLLQLYQASKTH